MSMLSGCMRYGLLCLCLVFGGHVYAQEEVAEPETSAEEGEVDPGEQAIYVPLKPPFVVNYGGAGPLKYLKTDISVRVNDVGVANSIRHHLPLIRNNLVMLFSAQTDESLQSQSARDSLRKEALNEVRSVLKMEDQVEGVVDLYFNSFVVQR